MKNGEKMFIDTDLLYNEAQKFGVTLDETALNRFDVYAKMLVETNKVMNLTAIIDPHEIVIKHFIDCLTFFKYVDVSENAKIIDVGTGAGFPSMVLLIARPDLKITMIDSLKKRLVFLQNVLDELGLNAQIIHARGEDGGRTAELREQFDFATARAVANLAVLSELCIPYVKLGGYFVAMKGTDVKEIRNAENAIKLLGGYIESVNSFEINECGSRNIVKIIKKSQTPTKYPRNSSQISKKPL